VNGHIVAKATDTHDPLNTGSVGLFASRYSNTTKPIEAQFDNFVVMKL
jgi:hypothetical protein